MEKYTALCGFKGPKGRVAPGQTIGLEKDQARLLVGMGRVAPADSEDSKAAKRSAEAESKARPTGK